VRYGSINSLNVTITPTTTLGRPRTRRTTSKRSCSTSTLRPSKSRWTTFVCARCMSAQLRATACGPTSGCASPTTWLSASALECTCSHPYLTGQSLSFLLSQGPRKDRHLPSAAVVLPIHERATRNCSWSGDLWANNLRALERLKAEHQVIDGASSAHVVKSPASTALHHSSQILGIDWLDVRPLPRRAGSDGGGSERTGQGAPGLHRLHAAASHGRGRQRRQPGSAGCSPYGLHASPESAADQYGRVQLPQLWRIPSWLTFCFL